MFSVPALFDELEKIAAKVSPLTRAGSVALQAARKKARSASRWVKPKAKRTRSLRVRKALKKQTRPVPDRSYHSPIDNLRKYDPKLSEERFQRLVRIEPGPGAARREWLKGFVW